MVLQKEQVDVNPKGYLEKREYNSFIVLDSSGISYDDEKELLCHSIEILNSIRVVKKANKMCSDFKSDFQINTDIYYKAMDSVLNNKSFSDADLKSYFESEQKKEEFLIFSRSLADNENELYLPYEVDFILLDMNMGAYNILNERKKDTLRDIYGSLACEVRYKNIGISDFILKAKELFISNSVINVAAE
ncbi:hypothetical protein SAMN05443549_101732 [Flavobacterium fluvii]|uniref:Uncharacterized protein n=1 Tax=Flavobacterium fluvii TaxID=468056 RepID=A0A1M5FD21_9FLAO|nr:hypothetical protein [Flavobacterium fluvii]SHF89414.1 hypothetical protein SAMN05443549_101732 [Flavobacterium fluvii]